MAEITAQFTGTQEVREHHRFDPAALDAYMREHVDGFEGPISVSQFRGGQSNPTYKIDTPGRAYVLRRKPPGKLLPSAHAVDREFRAISALQDTGVPVPRSYCLCEDADIVGTPFYIMEFVDGRVFWDPTLADLPEARRGEVYDAMNAALAALHNVDYAAVGLEGYGKVGEYRERQIHRWSKTYRISETEPIAEMERLMDWLPANIPPGDETSVVHGDYRLDNMIFHPTEPRVLAILDWELCTLGHPVGDFTYNLMTWRLPSGLFRGIGDYDLAALGLPDEQQYTAAYCRRTGRDGIDHLEWYLAYNMFRLAAILQGIAKRAIDGTASSEHAVEQGKRARPMAEFAWAQVAQIAG